MTSLPVPFTVAIDGPAAAGKGTIARAVAERFDLGHLDTGLLYRAVGRKTLAGMAALEAARSLSEDDLNPEDALRTAPVAEAASRVAVDTEVRAALVDFQRAFARRSGGAVLDGRDIGTVICPRAEVKLFVIADPEVRARRRYQELAGKGQDVTLEGVAEDLARRDARDAERADAPMVAADDAVVLDTSAMSIEDAVAQAIARVQSVLQP
ncbi:MAG: cytidylate kinase [Oceanicola sp.]|jgi:cytidylate kinase|nr:cytidylate kinase [Oceanicola sp.]